MKSKRLYKAVYRSSHWNDLKYYNFREAPAEMPAKRVMVICKPKACKFAISNAILHSGPF